MRRVIPNLVDRRAGFVKSSTKNVGIISKEERYQRSWDVQSWCKHYADVSHCHLVHSRVVHNLNQERCEVSQQLEVGPREFVYKNVEALNLLATLVHVYDVLANYLFSSISRPNTYREP